MREFTFKPKSYITNVRYPLKIIWNDIEIDEEAREKDCGYCCDGSLMIKLRVYVNQLCKSFRVMSLPKIRPFRRSCQHQSVAPSSVLPMM